VPCQGVDEADGVEKVGLAARRVRTICVRVAPDPICRHAGCAYLFFKDFDLIPLHGGCPGNGLDRIIAENVRREIGKFAFRDRFARLEHASDTFEAFADRIKFRRDQRRLLLGCRQQRFGAHLVFGDMQVQRDGAGDQK